MKHPSPLPGSQIALKLNVVGNGGLALLFLKYFVRSDISDADCFGVKIYKFIFTIIEKDETGDLWNYLFSSTTGM